MVGAFAERLLFTYIDKNNIITDFADFAVIDYVFGGRREKPHKMAGTWYDDFLDAARFAVEDKVGYAA